MGMSSMLPLPAPHHKLSSQSHDTLVVYGSGFGVLPVSCGFEANHMISSNSSTDNDISCTSTPEQQQQWRSSSNTATPIHYLVAAAASSSSNKGSTSAASPIPHHRDEASSWLQLGLGQPPQQQHHQVVEPSRRLLMLDLNLGGGSTRQTPTPTPTPTHGYYGSSLGLVGESTSEDMMTTLIHPPPPPPPPPHQQMFNFPSSSSSLSMIQPPPFRLIQPPPTRPHSGIWFMLQPSLHHQSRQPFLPQISNKFLRIKDGRMRVGVVSKYVVKKLGLLDTQSQVELRCRGQVLEEWLTLQRVRDEIWSTRGVPPLTSVTTPTSSSHLMLIHYSISSSSFT